MTVRETIRKIAPLISEDRANRFWQAYLCSNTNQKRDLENSLEAYAAKLLNDNPALAETGHFPPPPPERCLGDIELGKVLYGGKEMYNFGLRKAEMMRHIGVFGASGVGKSVCVCNIVDGLIQNSTPFWLIDFKETFRSLLVDYPEKVLVLTVGEKRGAPYAFNPLIPPPNVSWQTWAKKVIGNAVSMAFMQGAGSESLLLTALNSAYEDAVRQGRWPTFLDVAETLGNVKRSGRKGMWLDSAQRAIVSMTEGVAGEVFCPDTSVGLEALLNRNVVFELEQLSSAEASFFAQVLLLWLIHFRMANTRKREQLHHSVIIEEAQHLIGAASLRSEIEPVIHQALREIRELGESVVLATQNPSLVPVPIYGNLGTQISLSVRHANDVRATANALVLKNEEKDMLNMLPVGEAIVRVPRWKTPIHLRLFNRPMAKGTVTNAHIRNSKTFRAYSADTATFCRSLAKKDENSAIPRSDLKQVKILESGKPATIVSTTNNIDTTPTTTPINSTDNVSLYPEPSQLELQMLQNICAYPFDGVVQRIKRLDVSRRKGHAALKALEKRGLIKPENVYTGTSLMKLYNITNPAGRALCHQHHFAPLPDITEGGITHRYWVHTTAAKLRKEGWTVKTEHKVSNDLIVDIHAEKNGKTMAVLVETGKSRQRVNLLKTNSAGYDSVQVVRTTAASFSGASEV